MNRLKSIISLLGGLSVIKTIFVNLRVFGLRRGVRCPIFIFKHTEIDIKCHRIQFTCDLSPGIIRIGGNNQALFPKKNDYTKFVVDGFVQFGGRAHFYGGSCIIVKKNGILKIGDNFEIGGPSSIIAMQNITIGSHVMVSWDTLIMDSDLHKILNSEGEIINKHHDVCIGNDVWIGCRCCILKGAIIPDGNIIAAGSFINKQFDIKNSIIATNKVIRENVTWEGIIFE